jgi:uncharacterized protein YebE (UPF0316 family)
MNTSFFHSGLFSYVLMPVLIFLARICDVSIGTMRIIFVSKGKRNIAPILGFFEVLIWITAISKIMENLDHYINFIAYAAGFATGNLVGMIIEERLAMGILMIRVFAHERGNELVQSLNTGRVLEPQLLKLKGARENIHLIYSIIKRNELAHVLDIITHFNPNAFYTIEDVKAVNEGIFTPKKPNSIFPFSNVLRQWRKGK